MRALASQVMPSAKSRQSAREHSSASRQARRKSSSSRPTGACADHVARRGGRKSRDRHAARQRLQQHQAEGVGAAREHEHVGGGVDLGQRLALARAEKHRVGIGLRELSARRPIADHELGAGQIELEKRLEIFPPPPARRSGRSAAADRARARERGRNRLASTPRGHSFTFLKPRPVSSLPSVGVAASTAAPALWKRRSQPQVTSQVQRSGTGSRSAR